MSEIERGWVKFFNPAENKRFGFIRTGNREEIFFHFGDGALVELGKYGNFQQKLEPDFVVGKVPGKDPRKGDEIVFLRQSGRKGKGNKACPWAFASEYDRLVAMVGRIQQPNWWGDPKFVGFKIGGHSGWGPTTYYAYYPLCEGAWEASLYVRRFDTLLLYKSGDLVITGRVVRWNHQEKRLEYTRSGRAEEPVYGIIPLDALDGFWFWNGQRWELCQQVEAHATSVVVHGETMPSYYRFVGLRTESGRLVQKEVVEFTGQEFFEIRKLEDGETTVLPVVETIVCKEGFFTDRERHDWCEPNLTQGIEPRFNAVLNCLNKVMVTKARLNIYNSRLQVTITVPGDEPYVVEHIRGSSGGAPGDPTMWVQRTPGRTYVASYWYPNEADQRLLELEKQLESAEEVIGPYEEKYLRESGGKFYLEGENDEYGVYCPHGRRVSWKKESKSENPNKILAMMENGLQRSGKKPCPWCGELPEVIKPDFFRNHGGSILDTEWGVPEGMLPVEEFKKQIDRRQKIKSENIFLGFVPYDGYYVYRTPDGTPKAGILLVRGMKEEFLPASVRVIKAGVYLLDSHGQVVGKTGWERDYPTFFKVVKSTKREIYELEKAGILEQTLK